ncbi:MAG: RNA-binding domain-containing protein [Chloroflexota bacterium]
MPHEIDLSAMIAGGENQTVEFKRSIDNTESIAGEIVAFANGNGGALLVGVDDDGTIVGVGDKEGDGERVIQQLTNICRDRCVPPISPVVLEEIVDGKKVILLRVANDLNRQKPYRTLGGRFYVRVNREKKDATGRELIRIAQAAGELHYDESPVYGTSLADLSLADFSTYHEEQFGISLQEQLEESNLTLETLLHNLRLIHLMDGEITLSVACVLLFGNSPQRFLPQSRLSAVAFAGIDESADILDRREIAGRLPNIIDETQAFLARNIRKPAREHGFHREDISLYDATALGEAVVNAAAHRDYSLSGSQIRLFLFDDRIEVRSPGRLPNSVTLENIRLGVHAERNRAIATFLTQLGYMSAIGTGVPRLIIRLSRQLSGRTPEFVLVGEELRVTIWAQTFP